MEQEKGKGKAKELVNRFMSAIKFTAPDLEIRAETERAKACALICCDEIIDDLEDLKQCVDDVAVAYINSFINYQNHIKTEIEKL